MAPERLQGKPLTFATDIYALGITLHELFTQEVPFGYIDESDLFDSMLLSTCFFMASADMLTVVVKRGTRPDIEETGIPPEMVEIMQACWKQIPSERISSMMAAKRLRTIESHHRTAISDYESSSSPISANTTCIEGQPKHTQHIHAWDAEVVTSSLPPDYETAAVPSLESGDDWTSDLPPQASPPTSNSPAPSNPLTDMKKNPVASAMFVPDMIERNPMASSPSFHKPTASGPAYYARQKVHVHSASTSVDVGAFESSPKRFPVTTTSSSISTTPSVDLRDGLPEGGLSVDHQPGRCGPSSYESSDSSLYPSPLCSPPFITNGASPSATHRPQSTPALGMPSKMLESIRRSPAIPAAVEKEAAIARTYLEKKAYERAAEYYRKAARQSGQHGLSTSEMLYNANAERSMANAAVQAAKTATDWTAASKYFADAAVLYEQAGYVKEALAAESNAAYDRSIAAELRSDWQTAIICLLDAANLDDKGGMKEWAVKRRAAAQTLRARHERLIQ